MSSETEEENRKIAESFQQAAAYSYGIFKPVWDARSDVSKTLVTLSSASIVLSVTFSSSLKSLNVGLFWRYLVVFSFAMFVLSLISALSALWIGAGVHEGPANMLVERKEIQKAVEGLGRSNSDYMIPFDEILQKVNRPIETRDKWSRRFARASFLCFGAAILSLAVGGFRQLLP